MADVVQKIVPIKIQLDSDESLRDQFNACYILNLRQSINRNANAAIDGTPLNQGGNVGAQTPIQSPELICGDIELPEGNNICIGAYNSAVTQEIYWNVWNDEGNHSIWVYGTESGVCRKVYEGECLGFRFEPQYHVPAHRVALFIVYDADSDGARAIRNKFYVFTDGINWQRLIDVESSAATDSYNPITYPYFKTFYPHCDPCEFIILGIFPPQDCPVVLPFDDDTALQQAQSDTENNNLKNKVWYFATSFIDIWGRHSVMSPYSTAVFLDGGDCNADAEDIKCFRLQLDAGSWMVEKIVVYFSNDGINWFKYDEIDKWEDCYSPPLSPPVENFWERQLALRNYYAPNTDSPPCQETGQFQTNTYTWDLNTSPALEFCNCTWKITINGITYESTLSPPICSLYELSLWASSLGFDDFIAEAGFIFTSSDENVYGNFVFNCAPPEIFEPEITENRVETGTANTFIYQFCGNKQCIPVSPSEVARIFDDLPIASVAQAVIDDKIAYGNNLRGYDNFLCPISNIELTPVQHEPLCESELVTITMQAVIFNAFDNKNNPIYKMAGSTDIAMGGFGILNVGGINYETEVISAYNQQVISGIGIPAGLRGTNFKQYSQQFQIGTSEPIDMPAPVGEAGQRNMMQEAYNGKYYYQQWKFKVPKGNYIFEVYSHLSTIDDCEGTSTYMYGTCRKVDYNPDGALPGTTDNIIREIQINACEGDVTYENYILIADLTKPRTNVSILPDAKAFAGYLREVDTNVAVELADVDASRTLTIISELTDHNGFFFGADTGADYTVDLRVFDDSCNLQRATLNNLSISEKQLNVFNSVVNNEAALPNFNECAHELVSGTVIDCDGIPIGGIPVVLTRTGRYSITDADGIFTILAHDNAYIFDESGDTRKTENEDSLYIAMGGACLLSVCTDSPPQCETCIPTIHVDWTNSCFQCDSLSPPVVPTDTYNFTLELISGALTGWKTGGNYAVSIIGYDELDRNNQAQLVGFVQIPTIQSNGVFAPYGVNWAFNGLMNFPSWVKKIRFAVRLNDYQFLLSWATNKIEFLDSQGNITSPSIATKIKLYIDGLNEFRTQSFLDTNVGYDFVAGDRIRFLTNGDDTTFTTTGNNGLIDLPVSKLEDGNALLIPYDPRLKDLTAPATFELYRQPICETEPVYYEQCPSIPVLFNEETQTYEPTITSGTIPFYDTFWFFRAIPMTNQDDIPIVFVSPHRYEHYAPSDYWGTTFTADIPQIRLFARGRPFVRNENARQTWYLDEDGWSDSLLVDGVINGLGTWRTENRKNYSVQGAGGIVAMKAQTGLLWHLAENNWFAVSIAQNLLIITPQGNVQANPDYLGQKQPKIGNIYGCAYEDTNTILFIQEWLCFADASRSAFCISNYQTVWDVTKPSEAGEGGMQSYWIEKLRKVASLRSQNQFTDSFMYLHAGFSIKTNEIVITSFSRGSSPPTIEYGTDADDYDIEANETVSYNLAGYWSGNYSFTPERFIEFDSAGNGVQLLSFVQGKMWMHNVINPTTVSYNNFYETRYRKIVKLVMNGGEGKNNAQKIFLAVRIECKDEKFTCNEATTQTGQLSKIPAEAWDKISNYFEAPILMDENSQIFSGLLPLIDGTNLFGSWIQCKFVGEVDKENSYCEITGIIISSAESY